MHLKFRVFITNFKQDNFIAFEYFLRKFIKQVKLLKETSLATISATSYLTSDEMKHKGRQFGETTLGGE